MQMTVSTDELQDGDVAASIGRKHAVTLNVLATDPEPLDARDRGMLPTHRLLIVENPQNDPALFEVRYRAYRNQKWSVER
jgi:hypothetical protein